MEDMERSEESLEAQDREMLNHIHLHFMDGPGRPRTWEELPERDRELIRNLYREGTQGVTEGG